MKKARALRLIRKLKAEAGSVSDWEGEFLQSVETRLDTYGRAFADPEKGGRDSAVSVLQHHKLKEIGTKLAGGAAGEPAKRTGLVRRTPLGGRKRPEPPEDDS